MPDAKTKDYNYQNIVIISDLSDRIKPLINNNIANQQYPNKDVTQISEILDYFKNQCVKPGEKIGDKSCISFSTFSTETIACIDLNKFKNIGTKQEFINSTGEYLNKGLDYEINVFKEKVTQTYDSLSNKGLDLISILVDKIENKNIIKADTFITNGKDTTYISFENHIYVFTDGYLEYIGKSENSQFYYGTPEIEEIRKYCEKHKVNVMTALNSNPSFCLPIVKNDSNKIINLHILETAERDRNNTLSSYKHELGLRDNEILEAVWRKWATESGFKSFEWEKY